MSAAGSTRGSDGGSVYDRLRDELHIDPGLSTPVPDEQQFDHPDGSTYVRPHPDEFPGD